MRRLTCLCFLTMWGILTALAISPLSFSGSIPESGNEVTSFNDIQIMFDFSEIEQEFGSTEGWGIAREGWYDSNVEWCSGAILYEGGIEDGIILSQLTNSISIGDDDYVTNSNAMHLSFAGASVKPGQKYTIFINYIVYATNPDITGTWGYNDLWDNPIVLEVYGAESRSKVLSIVSTSLNELNQEPLSCLFLSFNSDVSVINKDASFQIFEGEELIAESKSVSTDEQETSIVKVEFDEISLYATHLYNLVAEAGIISMKEDETVTNSTISIPFEGHSYHLFGIENVRPRPNLPTINLSSVDIEFAFPEGCGFVWLSSQQKYPLYVYEGNEAVGDPIDVMNGKISETDQRSLTFSSMYRYEAGKTFTYLMEEGTVDAYDMGTSKKLGDYKSERIEFQMKTVDEAAIPKVTIIIPEDVNAESLATGYKIELVGYSYNDVNYGINYSETLEFPFYEIEGESKNQVASFIFGIEDLNLTLKALSNSRH